MTSLSEGCDVIVGRLSRHRRKDVTSSTEGCDVIVRMTWRRHWKAATSSSVSHRQEPLASLSIGRDVIVTSSKSTRSLSSSIYCLRSPGTNYRRLSTDFYRRFVFTIIGCLSSPIIGGHWLSQLFVTSDRSSVWLLPLAHSDEWNLLHFAIKSIFIAFVNF